MIDLERRALLGNRRAQEECTRLGILLRCPWCNGTAKIIVCDDEGNCHPDDYENDPWSGLGYFLYHSVTENPNCPIAHDEGSQCGCYIYDSRNEAISAWNTLISPQIGRCKDCDSWLGEPEDEDAPCRDCDGVMEADNFCRNFEPRSNKDGFK